MPGMWSWPTRRWPSARRRRAKAISRARRSSPPPWRPAPRRSIPAMASSPRMPISPRPVRRPASSSSARRPSAMRAMGSKSEAKALMERAGVPVVPGYHGADQDDGALAAAAKRIGYPVLLKASAGGGGKGMRRVDKPAEFADALASARREAKAAFGDDRMLVEKYLLRPAPCGAPGLRRQPGPCAASLRARLLDPAPASEGDRGGAGAGPGPGSHQRAWARRRSRRRAAVGYVGAGTIEFILDRSGEFFFMEMNTRLQVEHPVTEMITGLDLVRMAASRRLGRSLCRSTQAEVTAWGHAFEARIYAEDPARDFLPATGRLAAFRAAGAGRTCQDRQRRAAGRRDLHPLRSHAGQADRLGRGSRAGAPASCGGARPGGDRRARQQRRLPARRWPTIRPLPPAEVDTGFIERHHDALFAPAAPDRGRVLAAAVASLLLGRKPRRGRRRQPRPIRIRPGMRWMGGVSISMPGRLSASCWRASSRMSVLQDAAPGARAGSRWRREAGRIHRRRRRPPSHHPRRHALRGDGGAPGPEPHHILRWRGRAAGPDRSAGRGGGERGALGPADGAHARADRRSSMWSRAPG